MLVERLSPEEYLLGIAEMPYSWHPAALRAQAIAARTYLANVLANPPRGVMAEFGFDICGSALCQVYLGAGRVQVVDGGPRWGAAVAATAGKILLYDGTPALAAYHSTAGSTTRSNQDVWGGAAVPYLQAVEVPPQDSPFANWTYELRLDQLLQILEAAGITLPDGVTAVSTLVTEPGGGPYRVRFEAPAGTTEVTAGRIQSAMNTYGPSLYGWLLPAYRPDGKRYPQTVLSPTFTMATLSDGVTVRVEGQGWGHQIGMPQYGAQAMALAGRRHRGHPQPLLHRPVASLRPRLPARGDHRGPGLGPRRGDPASRLLRAALRRRRRGPGPQRRLQPAGRGGRLGGAGLLVTSRRWRVR